MSIHPDSCDCDTLGCRLRREGLFTLTSTATPSRRRHQPFRDPAKVNHNSWENGIAGEHRPGGFMPYLGPNGERMHVKDYADHHVALDSIRHQQVTAPSNEKVS